MDVYLSEHVMGVSFLKRFKLSRFFFSKMRHHSYQFDSRKIPRYAQILIIWHIF